MNRVKNYNVAVKEKGDSVIFLHKILPGSADKSYGIHVAKLAGLPKTVLNRANEVLANLEGDSLEIEQPKLARSRKPKINPDQLSLFDFED